MKIYLDVCCLNRPFDDQTQDRIRLESEAIILILMRFRTSGVWEWISSEAVSFEIGQTPDAERRHRVASLIGYADYSVLIDASIVKRASELEKAGFDAYDAIHLACAENCGVDVFLTTDDKLLRLAGLNSKQLKIDVYNPLVWLREVIEDEHRDYDS